jgi:hypothetical protein
MSASRSLLGQPLAMRSRVWVSQACGSTLFIFAVYADRGTMLINQVFANVSGMAGEAVSKRGRVEQLSHSPMAARTSTGREGSLRDTKL